jgi:P-type E1-E2 ATPase
MARALVAAARSEAQDIPMPAEMMEMAGQGVTGQVEGHAVDVGSVAYALEKRLGTEETFVRARHAADAADDATAVVGIDGRAAGLLIYRDPVRPAATQLVQRLHDLGVRETEMLTGDDQATARSIAARADIETVRADLLPADKVQAVRELLQRHSTVVMVGDGINDGPALATATVGVAMGAHGAAVSAEAADIVIATDDLGRVADSIDIGRRTLRIAKESIWVGLGVSGALMAVAAFGYIPPAIGALLQEALDVTVIANALRAR